MPAALQRSMVAGKGRSDNENLLAARNGKLPLAFSASVRKLPKGYPQFAPVLLLMQGSGPSSTKSCRSRPLWPSLARSWPTSANNWQMLAKVGPNFAKVSNKVARLGQHRPNLGQIPACGATSEQLRTMLGQLRSPRSPGVTFQGARRATFRQLPGTVVPL